MGFFFKSRKCILQGLTLAPFEDRKGTLIWPPDWMRQTPLTGLAWGPLSPLPFFSPFWSRPFSCEMVGYLPLLIQNPSDPLRRLPRRVLPLVSALPWGAWLWSFHGRLVAVSPPLGTFFLTPLACSHQIIFKFFLSPPLKSPFFPEAPPFVGSGPSLSSGLQLLPLSVTPLDLRIQVRSNPGR